MTAIDNIDDDAGLAAAAGRDADVFDFLRRDNEDESSIPVTKRTPAAALQAIHERARELESEGLDIEDLMPDIAGRNAREDQADFAQLDATGRLEAAQLIADNFRNRTYSTEFARHDPQSAQEILLEVSHAQDRTLKPEAESPSFEFIDPTTGDYGTRYTAKTKAEIIGMAEKVGTGRFNEIGSDGTMTAHVKVDGEWQLASEIERKQTAATAVQALSRQIQNGLRQNEEVGRQTPEEQAEIVQAMLDFSIDPATDSARRAAIGIEERSIAFANAVTDAKHDKLATLPPGDIDARLAESRTPEPNVLPVDVSRQWATLDAQEFNKIQGEDHEIRRETAAGAIAANMAANAEYNATMAKDAPAVAAAANRATAEIDYGIERKVMEKSMDADQMVADVGANRDVGAVDLPPQASDAAASPADSRPKRPSRSEAMYRKFDKAVQDGQIQSAMEIAMRPEFSANQSIDGVPVLSVVLRAGETPLVETLISRGADVNAPDKDGLAPIHYAKTTADVDRLQQAGASIDTTQPLPAVVAEALGQQEASKLRESHQYRQMEEKRSAEFRDARAMLDQKAQGALSIGVIQDTQQQHHVAVERDDDMRSYSRWPTRSAALSDESNLRGNIAKFGESVANFFHLPKITKRPAPENTIRYDAEPLVQERPATPRPNVDNEIADNRLPLPAIASRVLKTHELPENFQKKFIVSDAVPGQFFHHDQNRKLAFADKGPKLVTDDHRPEVVGSMIELAKAKGWSTLSLKGSDEFKREAWMQASLAGIEVNGFKPKPEDVAMLDQLRNERMGNSLYRAVAPSLPTLTNEMQGGTTRTKPEADRLQIPEDYKPSPEAIAAAEKMRTKGVPESKLRLAMYGVDLNNRIATQLGLQPFQARIFDAATSQRPQGKGVSIAVEKQQPQMPMTDIAQPAPSIRR